MAIINKTGVTDGGTIQAEHVTRVIDALSGVSTDTLILSGSMTGSLKGILTGTASVATTAATASKLTVAVADTTAATFYPLFVDISSGGTAQGNTDVNFTYNPQTNTLGPSGTAAFTFQGTASLATTASFAVSSSRAISSSFATTASYALNAGSGTGGSEYMTIRLSHAKETGLTGGTTTYFGPGALVPSSTITRRGAFLPFDCILVSASFYSECEVLSASGKTVTNRIYYDTMGSPSTLTVGPGLPLDTFMSGSAVAVGSSTLSKGKYVNASLIPNADDGSVEYIITVDLLIKKV